MRFPYLVDRASRSAVFWGFSSCVVRIGGGLIVLPLVVTQVSSGQLGLWFLFISLHGIFVPVVLASGSTAARALGFAQGGATNLHTSGFEPLASSGRGAPNLPLLATLNRTYALFFLGLSLALGTVQFAVGSLWLFLGSTGVAFGDSSHRAFVLYCLASALGFYSAWSLCQLGGGLNKVRLTQLITLAGIAVNYLVNMLGLIFGWKILALVAGTLANALISIAIAQWHLGVFSSGLKHVPARFESHYLRLIMPQSTRSFLLYTGRWLTLSGPLLAAGFFLPLSQVASLGLSLQIGTLLSAFSAVWVSVKFPLFHPWWVTGRKAEIEKVFFVRLRLLLITFGVGSAALVVSGPLFLALIHARTELLPLPLLGALLVFLFLNLHQSMFEDLLATANQNLFGWHNILAGCIALGLIAVSASQWGVWGFVLIPLLTNLVWNNWWVVLRSVKTLRFDGYPERLFRPVHTMKAGNLGPLASPRPEPETILGEPPLAVIPAAMPPVTYPPVRPVIVDVAARTPVITSRI